MRCDGQQDETPNFRRRWDSESCPARSCDPRVAWHLIRASHDGNPFDRLKQMSCHWLPSSCHWAVNKLVKQILIGSSLESQRRRIIPEERGKGGRTSLVRYQLPKEVAGIRQSWAWDWMIWCWMFDEWYTWLENRYVLLQPSTRMQWRCHLRVSIKTKFRRPVRYAGYVGWKNGQFLCRFLGHLHAGNLNPVSCLRKPKKVRSSWNRTNWQATSITCCVLGEFETDDVSASLTTPE